MKKKLIVVAVGALVVCGLLLSSGALATKPSEEVNPNGFPSGGHYNLNIIGKANSNFGVVGGSQSAHTIFVPENTTGKAGQKVDIWMWPSLDGTFRILDRSAFDDDENCDLEIPKAEYDVYARALGKPGGKVNITAKIRIADDGVEEILLGSFDLNRSKGKPKAKDISSLFYYGGAWVFSIDEFEDYLWEYKNKDLKLLQVRFYPRE